MMRDVKLTRKLGENHFKLPYVSVLVSIDPEEFDRIAHSLQGVEKFMKMMFRFREATDSFDPSCCHCLEYPPPRPDHCDPETCPSPYRAKRFTDGW